MGPCQTLGGRCIGVLFYYSCMLEIFHNSMLEERKLMVSNSRGRGQHLTHSMNFSTNTERNQTCSTEAKKATALYIIQDLYNTPWAGIWPFPRQLFWKSTRSLSLYMTDGFLTHVGCWVGGESPRLVLERQDSFACTWLHDVNTAASVSNIQDSLHQ